MTLDHTIKLFMDHQLANGRSPHTIGAQQRDLKLLIKHLDSDYNIREISKQLLLLVRMG